MIHDHDNADDGTTTVVSAPICVPQYRPNERWQMRRVQDTYTGPDGIGTDVPHVDDLIIDLESGSLSKVVKVNLESDYLYETVPYAFGVDDDDPLTPPASFLKDPHRVYIDYERIPSLMHVDTQMLICSAHAAYAKIFEGTEIYREDLCISLMYNDDRSSVISNRVPLTVVALDSHESHHVKAVDPCWISRELSDGDLLTVAFYTDEGVLIRKSSAVTEIVSWLGDMHNDSKFVTGLRVQSPYLSVTEPNTLIVPRNTSYDALHITGKVIYRSGREVLLGASGDPLKVLGVEAYRPESQPRLFDMGLRYSVGREESAIATKCDKFVLQPFQIRLVDWESMPSLTLFPMLSWGGDRFVLRWWGLSVDTPFSMDVTEWVRTYEGPEFVGNAYEVRQNLRVTVNSQDIPDATMVTMATLDLTIELFNPAADGAHDWFISNLNDLPGDDNESQIYIEKSSDTCIMIAGAANGEAFMARTYDILPRLLHMGLETTDYPTHLHYINPTGDSWKCPIEDWLLDLEFASTIGPDDTVQLFFYKHHAGSAIPDKYLGVTTLMVR